MITRNGDIEVSYEVVGDTGSGIPLLLVHGLGMQLVGWSPDLLDFLVERGYAVVVFDNRDVGLSTHLTDVRPDVLAAIHGTGTPPYLLADMAGDALAVLDAAGLPEVHVLGVSMGGMIAQQLAIDAPARVRSLTSIMSTTGDRSVGKARAEALPALLTPPPADRAGYLEHSVTTARTVGSPGFAFDEAGVRARAEASFDRAYDPMGTGRQLAAIGGSPDRTPGLRSLGMPALVVHGVDDPLVEISGGRATAAAIHGAQWLEIEGMGHDLPVEVWPRVLDALDAVVARGQAAYLTS